MSQASEGREKRAPPSLNACVRGSHIEKDVMKRGFTFFWKVILVKEGCHCAFLSQLGLDPVGPLGLETRFHFITTTLGLRADLPHQEFN